MIKITREDQWFRYWMPYVFVKIDHPKLKHVYLPLNRNYKPLGQSTDKFVDYMEYLDQAIIFKRSPDTLEDIWMPEDTPENYYYLYTDSQSSRNSYGRRFQSLMEKSVRLVAAVENNKNIGAFGIRERKI